MFRRFNKITVEHASVIKPMRGFLYTVYINNHTVCNSIFVVSNVNRLFTSGQGFLFSRQIIISKTKQTISSPVAVNESSV